MKPNLKFKIDTRWGKRTWLDRFSARQTALMIFNAKGDTYQFSGIGMLHLSYEMIDVDVDKFQLMHWILREAGYNCCAATIMKRCGIDVDVKTRKLKEIKDV